MYVQFSIPKMDSYFNSLPLLNSLRCSRTTERVQETSSSLPLTFPTERELSFFAQGTLEPSAPSLGRQSHLICTWRQNSGSAPPPQGGSYAMSPIHDQNPNLAETHKHVCLLMSGRQVICWLLLPSTFVSFFSWPRTSYLRTGYAVVCGRALAWYGPTKQLVQKRASLGAWEMTQSAKNLPHKYEDLSSDP